MKTSKALGFAVVGLIMSATLAPGFAEDEHAGHHPQDPAQSSDKAAPSPKASQSDKAAAPDMGMGMEGAKQGGMMSPDHMSRMMKMMQDMHGNAKGGMSMLPKGDTGPSSLAFSGIAARMHQDMAITYTGNADVDFVKGMIPLHKAAVDMAKTVLAFGKDPDVRKVAEDVVKTQEAEIATLEDWLKKHQ